jgi:hypothetical protein
MLMHLVYSSLGWYLSINLLRLREFARKLAMGFEVYLLLDFDDGLLPSAHGWAFQGRMRSETLYSNPRLPLFRNGTVHLDTTPFGGDIFAFGRTSIGIDPANFVIEVRMRATGPDAERSDCAGSLGVFAGRDGDLGLGVSLLPRQLNANGVFVPGGTCNHEPKSPVEGSTFHTYKSVFQCDYLQLCHSDRAHYARRARAMAH